MDLLEYLAIWGRRWRIVVGATLLGVAVAVGTSALMTPTYVATAKLFVTTTGGASVVEAYQGNLFGQERVQSYVNLAMGRQVAQRAVDQLDINLTPEQLQSLVVAQAVPNSVMLTIAVENASPTAAKDIANAVAAQTSRLVEELETSVRGGSPAATATIVDKADTPASATTPKWAANILYGFFGGLLIGLTAAIARDKLDHSVRSDVAAAAAAGTDPLGTVPTDAARSGLPFGDTDAASNEAYRALRTAVVAGHDSSSSGAVIVASPTEDAAQVTLGLSAALAESGRTVIAVEANLRDNQMSRALGLEDHPGLTDVLSASGDVDVHSAITPTGTPDFDVLTAGTTPEHPSALLSGPRMLAVLKDLCESYDFVLVSAGPLLRYADSLAVAEWTDGLLLLAREGVTTDRELAEVADKAKLARTRLLGVVTTTAAKNWSAARTKA